MGNIPPSALRPPPPPPLRRSGSSPRSSIEESRSNSVSALTTGEEEEEEGNTSTVTVGSSSVNPRNRPFCSSTNIHSLPDDVLAEILLRAPTEDIHNHSRLVCERWYSTIRSDNFVQSHLRRSLAGLLLGKNNNAQTIFVTAAAEGGMQISRSSYPSAEGGMEISKSSYPSGFHILTSCNGLVLGIDTDLEDVPCIVNPATRTRFYLPQLPHTLFGCRAVMKYFGLAYVAASMEYKVVATYCHNPQYSMCVQCAILTVGVDDTWRNVVTQHLSPEAKMLLPCTPLITEGFVHWAWEGHVSKLTTSNPRRFDGILSMNVETEIISEIPAPLPPLEAEQGFNIFTYLSTGRHLSALIPCGDLLWDVWEMVGETGEWRNLGRQIDLRAHESRISQIHSGLVQPLGWVEYPNVLAFSFSDSPSPCIAYNLDADEIDSFDLYCKDITYVAVVHRNSLVRLA